MKTKPTMEEKIKEVLPYLMEKDKSFTIPTVKEATGFYGPSVGTSLSVLKQKGYITRISHGVYVLAAIRAPSIATFEAIVKKIREFAGKEFTVSDLRSKFVSEVRPISEEVLAVLSRLKEANLVSSLGNGYYSQILVTNSKASEVLAKEVEKIVDEQPTEALPETMLQPASFDPGPEQPTERIEKEVETNEKFPTTVQVLGTELNLPDGRNLVIDDQGKIWVLSYTLVGDVNKPLGES